MNPSILQQLKNYAKTIKQNIYVLYLSYKDARVPWYAKAFAVCVVAYAFSPIDLIPDFIPILGYLDDLVIVPLGITLALRLIPPHIIEENREKAEEMRKNGKPKHYAAAILFVLVWILLAVWTGILIVGLLQ
ncbi:YkvA family protein [Paenibacillus sp. VCA1]|uniref:YkvA family protein n=1 Tax=Paenibacillus sp. VCA1 TaxID=3039148 RepID=UPI002871B5C7|nr:YkvA family protein [Paenibacillus sp. VCA1]MDR9856061.1 YkvA family protein [Paenibacillus sp. VCA1]